MNNTTSAGSHTNPADTAGRLERAIMYMLDAYLSQGLIERSDIVNLLEDIIQRMERDRERKAQDPV
jgi:hypothetical protein